MVTYGSKAMNLARFIAVAILRWCFEHKALRFRGAILAEALIECLSVSVSFQSISLIFDLQK